MNAERFAAAAMNVERFAAVLAVEMRAPLARVELAASQL